MMQVHKHTHIEVDKVPGFVSDKGPCRAALTSACQAKVRRRHTETPANNTVPGLAIQRVKTLLDMRRHVFLDSLFSKRLTQEPFVISVVLVRSRRVRDALL